MCPFSLHATIEAARSTVFIVALRPLHKIFLAASSLIYPSPPHKPTRPIVPFWLQTGKNYDKNIGCVRRNQELRVLILIKIFPTSFRPLAMSAAPPQLRVLRIEDIRSSFVIIWADEE